MKSTYPVEYYAALLSANTDDKDKLSIYMDDCRRLDLKVLLPDVNFSGAEFRVEDGAIRFGLGAIKGCGRAVIEGMVAARESGPPFKDLFDFCERVQGGAVVNKNTIECLIRVGAFSSINGNRAQLVEMLPDAMSAASAKLRDLKSGQTGLFGQDSDVVSYAPQQRRYDHITDFADDEIYAMEKDLVGLYLSGHPLDALRPVLERSCTANAGNYSELDNDQECVIGGIISDVQIRLTRRNEKMASIKLEDLLGTISITFFPSSYRDIQPLPGQGQDCACER